jgi:hypothetical protein
VTNIGHRLSSGRVPGLAAFETAKARLASRLAAPERRHRAAFASVAAL